MITDKVVSIIEWHNHMTFVSQPDFSNASKNVIYHKLINHDEQLREIAILLALAINQYHVCPHDESIDDCLYCRKLKSFAKQVLDEVKK